jgi:hypothetical protein
MFLPFLISDEEHDKDHNDHNCQEENHEDNEDRAGCY